MCEWPGPRERRVVPEQRELFPEVEEVEQPTCYCCGAEAVEKEWLAEWGLAVDVCAECAGSLRFAVLQIEGTRWNESVVECEVHGPITHLDCTELEFSTERGGRVYPRKSKAGRAVYPVTFEMSVW